MGFPPRSQLIREITPTTTKHGTLHQKDFRWLPKDDEPADLSPFSEGATFSLLKTVEFKPSSTKQVVTRLNEVGWSPTEKTKIHKLREKERHKNLPYFKEYGWTISEENLSTLPRDAPEGAQQLVEYLILNSRRRTLTEWFQAYSTASRSIHGTINPIGTWPHRVSHRAPNMGNVPTKKSNKYNEERHKSLALHYGERLRSCWEPHDNCWQVGCDADAAHLRILAHLCNDSAMITACTTGDKKKGTDIHTRNMEAIGSMCVDRDRAKTFIYSWINGAGAPLISHILNCTQAEAALTKERFAGFYPGLAAFLETQVPIDRKRGYIYSIDGRPILFPSDHTIIAAYLLSGEAAIMKLGNILWYEQLKKEGVPFWQMNFVHDEWQTCVLDSTPNLDVAMHVCDVQEESIKKAGEMFELNCPMKGEATIGLNWYQTH